MFYPYLIRLFGTMSEVIHVDPRCLVVGTRPPTYNSLMILMIFSCALIQRKSSHE